MFGDVSYGELPYSTTEHMFLTHNGKIVDICLSIQVSDAICLDINP